MVSKSVAKRDASRNIGEELLQAIRDVKAGKAGAEYSVSANEVVETRLKCGLSQSEFAAALHISPRTLQQWEQGRRQPSGAAETLLRIVSRHPKVLREVMQPRPNNSSKPTPLRGAA
ncbi:DNA-binding transcriptional regulator [Lysobacter sp. N42]|uniref:helix-turn-helix domain-containing protein n=1 Tax=Lysobacter sp. N42 TaxID=2545719 RepID=UPI001A9D12F3|nr:helix-turn-helix domain-containing protein [Lysobacter sp. N42]